MNKVWLFCIGLISVISCDKRTVEDLEADFGYEYFPLKVGLTWEYVVDSVVYDPSVSGTHIDSSRWFWKEVIVDTSVSVSGEVLYKTERYVRRTEQDPWLVNKVFSLSKDAARAYRTEDNLRFIKMVFPLKSGINWDGNLYVDKNLQISIAGEVLEVFKGWEYKVEDKGIQATVQGKLYEEVTTIQNANEENLIEYRYVVEQYAPNVGLISRVWRILDTQCNVCCSADFAKCTGLPWEKKAEKGLILRQELVRVY